MAARIIFLFALAIYTPGTAWAITPDNPGPSDVLLSINAGQNNREISPYIYGINFYDSAGFSAPATLDRLGGNRWTAYNWETNASNAGKDYKHQNDYYLTNNVANLPPGASVSGSLQEAAENNRGLVVTVPMAGYVSADAAGLWHWRNLHLPQDLSRLLPRSRQSTREFNVVNRRIRLTATCSPMNLSIGWKQRNNLGRSLL